MSSLIMNKNFLVLLISASIAITGCGESSQSTNSTATVQQSMQASKVTPATQQDVDNISSSLDVKYQVLTNIPTDQCDKTKADGLCYEAQITFTASEAIPANGWNIHFSHIAPIQSFDSEEFTVKHINGDLHKISLKSTYKGFEKGESKTLMFRAMFWMLAESDAMPNYIVSAKGTNPRVITSTVPSIDAETGLEILPFIVALSDYEKQFKRSAGDNTKWLDSSALYQRNLMLGQAKLDVSQAIIPTPKSVSYQKNNALLDLATGISVDFGNVKKADVSVALARLNRFGILESSAGISLKLAILADAHKTLGSYQLAISEKGIKVIGVDAAGVFNGLQ